MSKAIDEMRAYFNQMPVPPKGALLEARKKVNAMIDAVEAENTKLLEELEAEHVLAETLGHYHEDAKAESDELRKLLTDMRYCSKHNHCSRCYFLSEKCDFDDRMRELGVKIISN